MQDAPFASAEDAWFWTMSMLDRRGGGPAAPRRACAPEEVLRCLDDIYRRRRIVLLHAHVLRLYGRRGRAPVPGRPRERCDRILWSEAMEHLDCRLRERGLVGGLARWVPRE